MLSELTVLSDDELTYRRTDGHRDLKRTLFNTDINFAGYVADSFKTSCIKIQTFIVRNILYQTVYWK